MTLSNRDIADFFIKYAENLDDLNDNPFRIRAYRRAAYRILKCPQELNDLVQANYDLTQLPGIGKIIAKHITEIIKTENLTIRFHRSTKQVLVNELSQITGLGLKRIAQLQKVQINNKKKLLQAIETGKLINLNLPGFSKKMLDKIHLELLNPKASTKFFRLFRMINTVEHFLKAVRSFAEVSKIEAVSDFRRKTEIIQNLEFVMTLHAGKKLLLKKILQITVIKQVYKFNSRFMAIQLWDGIEANINIVSEEQYGFALFYQTGSKSHLEAIRAFAADKELLLNERGLYKNLYKNRRKIIIPSEIAFYKQLGLQWIPPELRENRGEIQAAKLGKLPKLIEIKDIRGDLHSHTNETDGREQLETMMLAALDRGYEYLAITDHSQHLKITNGLDKKRLFKQIKQIDRLNEKIGRQFLLKASEVDILANGELDFPKTVLKELDITVCSVHSLFRLREKQQTERIIRAMDNPYFNILGHATGRLIRKREGYTLDMERIFEAAKDRGCFIELNAQPYRLDIDDVYCQMAKKMGVKLAISSDAHSKWELDYMIFGIYQARRGWLQATDVINTRPLAELKKLLKRK